MDAITLLAARQIVNTSVLCLSLVVCFVFLRHLRYEVQKPGWYDVAGNKAGIGLFVFFAGEAVARTWTVLFLTGERANPPPHAISLVGGAIAVVGALCCIRVLSPAKWGEWPWVFSAIVTAAVTAYVVINYP